jgi:hypothetical protein
MDISQKQPVETGSGYERSKLCFFVPYDTVLVTGPYNWKVEKDKEHVRVVRRNLLAPSMVACGIALGVFVAWAIYMTWGFIPFGMSVIWGVIGLFTVIAVPLGNALMILWNNSFWENRVRLQVDIQTKAFFFPRENKRYTAEDYSEIVLGCVWGFYTYGMDKIVGRAMTGGRSNIAHAAVAQVFILVRTNDGQWIRHEIASDNAKGLRRSKYGSAPFDELISILQPLTNCEVFFHQYTLEECFYQQRNEEPSPTESAEKKVLW